MAAPFQQTRTLYQDHAAALAPTAFRQPNGAAFLAAHGSMKDALLDRCIAAVKAHFPSVAPADALAIIGADRMMPRGATESDTAYAARLFGAWTAWPWAGTAFGVLSALYATGYMNVVIGQVVGGRQFTLDANGALVLGGVGSWTPSYVGDPFWSRFDVVFPQPLPASWQSGGVPASGSSEANFIRALIKTWSPAHATLNSIIIVTAGGVWDVADGTWDDGGTWDASTTTVWT